MTTAAHSEKSVTHWRKVFAFLLFGVVILAALALASSSRAAVESPPPPQVWSDKADYAPGEQVTLSGANWAVGEAVHIRVNDDAGQTWSRDVDVVAGDDGTISDQFNLPDWFVAQYTVTAAGASSGTATWSFTDGNVTLHPAPAGDGVTTYRVTYDLWNNTSTDCGVTGTATPSSSNLTLDVTSNTNIPGFGGSTSSALLKTVAVLTPATGKTFDKWTSGDNKTDSGTVVASPACVTNNNSGGSGNLTDLYAHFKNANAAPVCTNGSATTPEDTAVAAPLSCTDADGNTLSYTIVSGPTNGVLSGTGASRTYTPNANYNGSDSFTFKANDGTVDSNTATFNLTVTAVNDAPDAVDDSASVAEDSATGVLIDVLANDTKGPANESGQTLTITAVGTPSHGSAVVESGKIRYTPTQSNYNGPDSFTYTITDNGTTNGVNDFKTDSATVSITVTAVNDAPVCTNGSATTPEDTAVGAPLSCTDVDGNALSYTIVSDPANGGLSGTAPNLTYTPNANYNGSDSFTFKANDSTVDSNTATFSLTITEVNDAPTAVADAKSVAEDGTLTFAASTLTTNDSAGPANESGQTLTVTAVAATASTHGTVSLAAGSVTYTPDADFNGLASFSYTVTDNGTTNSVADPKSANGTVNVTVTEVNDAPVPVADSKTMAEDGTLTFPASDLTLNDSPGPANESTQTLTVISVTGTASTHGSVSLAAGDVTYTPDADFNGLASFDYTVQDNGTTDGSPDFKTGTVYVNVTVTEVNDAPTAVADAKSVAEDGTLTFAASTLTTNDSAGPANESGQTLTVTAVAATASTHGTVSLAAGSVTYTPAADFNGAASFSYTVTDNGTTNSVADPKSANGTVNVTVTEVNDAPDAVDDNETLAEDTNVLVDVLGNDSTGPANESTQTLTIDSVSTPAHGTAVIQSGKVKYTPNADYNGSDSFTYTAKDNGTTNGIADPKTDTATVSVTVTEVNDAPTAGTDSASVAEDGSLTISTATLTSNDSAGPPNESGQSLTIIAVGSSASTHGTVSLNGGTGEVTYTPDANYNGPASFTYTLRDNGTTDGASDPRTATGTVNVTVTEVNDAPHAVTDSASVAEDSATGVLIDVLANDTKGATNESGQTLTITSVGTPSHGTAVLESGKIRYTPTEANYNGPDSFGYTITDNGTTNGAPDPKSDSATVSITVTPVNDNPSVARNNASVSVSEGQTANNSGTYSDVDGDNVAITASVGTVTKTGVGSGTWSWSFNTTDGPSQSQTVTITANDGHGGTATTTFALTVNNVKPTITDVTATNTYSGPLVFMTSMIKTFFTDPGADANWTAALNFSDGGTDAGSGSASPITINHTFLTPGCKTVTARVTDKDGATSDPFGPTSINVGTGEFLPPVTNTRVTNKLKNGQVLPVKIRLTDCNGAAVSNLAPAIILKEGDYTTGVADDGVAPITVDSVSGADTNGIMRSVDGSYIYNMRVNVPKLNTDYTIIIYPFGMGDTSQSIRHVIQATK